MRMPPEKIREKLIIKAVRNVRRGYEKDESDRGMYRPGIRLDLQRSRLLTESYRETEGRAMVIRRALALKNILSRMDIYIQEWERIVGNNVSTPQGLYFGIDMNWRSVKRIVSGEEGQDLLDDEGREELARLVEYWKGRSMSDLQQALFSGDVLKYWRYEGTFLWTHWSELGIPDYEKIFRIGLRGLIREAEERLEEIDRAVPTDYIDQKQFLQSVVIALEAVIGFARRYADMARALCRKTENPGEQERLQTIAAICEKVPENPPETFAEAIQSFFFLHIVRYLESSTLGIGVRFDKIFGPYYEKDLAEGRMTRDDALEMLQLLWVKFHELGLVYSPMLTSIYGGVASLQAVTLGGVDEAGNDVTNELTYLVLETAEQMRTLEPSIALRYHDGTPDRLLSKATDVIRSGIGYPSLFNDKAILPLLDAWQVPPADARNYAVTGCVYLEIPGKSVTRRAFGGLILPKCLWWALHQGRHPETGEQWGASTPDPRTFQSAQDLLDAYLEQVRFFFDKLFRIEYTCRNLYQKYLPRPYYSALLEGCIEKGQDCRQWVYPSPVHDICIIIGPTNVADAVTAVKKVVFEEQRISMAQLLEALGANWQGHEEIRQMMLRAPKFGNDDDEADDIARAVHHRTSDVLAEFKNPSGCPCRGDGSGVSATYGAALTTPATPDGRRDGEAFADATLSPLQGMDRRGPTAVLQSASKISTVRTYNHLLNQKFQPSHLEGPMKEIFLAYLRSWGDLGISHIQFNIIDRQTLIDAQKDPAAHPDLIVRVAGYSAYFADLSKGLQDSIIERTEQRLA